ncbi:hypothetical protein HK405_011334, partial [Cladochytrium tenue]
PDRIPGSPTPAARRPAVPGGHPAPAGGHTNAGTDHPAGSFGALLAAIDLQLEDSPQPSTAPHDLGVAFASSANHNDAQPEHSWIPYRAPSNARGTNRMRVTDDDDNDEDEEDMEGWWPAASSRSAAAAAPRLREHVPSMPTALTASIGAKALPATGPGSAPGRRRHSAVAGFGRSGTEGDDEEADEDEDGVYGGGETTCSESDEEFVPGPRKRAKKGSTEPGSTARRQGGRGRKRRSGSGYRHKCSWVGCGKAFTTR